MSMPVWSVVNIFKDGDTTLMPTLTVSVMSSIEFLSILQPRNFIVYLIIMKSLTLLWVTSFMCWIQPTPWNWLTSWRPVEKVSSNSENWWIFPSAQKCAKSFSWTFRSYLNDTYLTLILFKLKNTIIMKLNSKIQLIRHECAQCSKHKIICKTSICIKL